MPFVGGNISTWAGQVTCLRSHSKFIACWGASDSRLPGLCFVLGTLLISTPCWFPEGRCKGGACGKFQGRTKVQQSLQPQPPGNRKDWRHLQKLGFLLALGIKLFHHLIWKSSLALSGRVPAGPGVRAGRWKSHASCQRLNTGRFLLHLLAHPSALFLPDSSGQCRWGWRGCGLAGWQLRGWQADNRRVGVRVNKA